MSDQSRHLPTELLEAGWESIKAAPKTEGVVELIVRRPGVDLRETTPMAQLDETVGLVGDGWRERGSSRTLDKEANPDAQLTLMNSRAIAVIAGDKERWPLAGDQLYTDFDLSADNLPAGSLLKVGDAVIEITAEPHTGCAKFKARYGADAVAFVNSASGLAYRLRGVNARIVTGGAVHVGAPVVKL